MSAVPKPVPDQRQPPNETVSATRAAFLKYWPAVRTHAAIKFRDLSAVEREEAIAEATAAAFLNVHNSVRNGKSQNLKPWTVATYAVLHVRAGNHVGGSRDRAKDVLSPRAQSRYGFQVLGLPWDSPHAYDCMKDTTAPAWRDRLREDRRANVADLVAFRLDLSEFLRRQHDRTRRALALLAQGYKQTEVADRLGVTPSAVNQRVRRAEREWTCLQQVDAAAAQPKQHTAAQPAT